MEEGKHLSKLECLRNLAVLVFMELFCSPALVGACNKMINHIFTFKINNQQRMRAEKLLSRGSKLSPFSC